jgi:two-component system, LytTR family, sensor histidine kinase AlgZ
MLYTAAWMLILALLTATLWASGKVDWRIALRGLAPAGLLFAFICLTPWYLCRVRPLRLPHRAIAPSLGAALAGSAVFAAAAGLASPPLAPHLPLLFALGVLLYLLSTGLHYAAIASLEQRSAEQHAAEARSLARESQLQALKFQLNPHFLFNSLHSIAALATLDGLRAREMCIRLSEFLRSSLSGAGPQLPRSGTRALRRAPASGGTHRVVLRRLSGAGAAAAAAGGKRGQARNRGPAGRRRHPAGGYSQRRRRLD